MLKKNTSLILLGTLLLVLLLWFIRSTIFPISGDFRNNLWEPAYLLVRGMNPYNIEGIFDNLNPLWFPTIIGLFFPLGYLPLQQASNLWFVISCLSLFTIVAIMARSFRKPAGYVMLTIFLLALFPSSVGVFKFGQVSLFVCLLLLLLTFYYRKLNPFFLGLLLSLSITKPQLAVIFIPTFLVIYFREAGVKRFFHTIFSAVLWVLILCLPLFIAHQNWVPTFLSNLYTNPLWAYPTLYHVLVSLLGFRGLAIILAGLYLTIGIGLSVFLSFKINAFEALLWSMALTPLFSPVVWSNDFVLMYPLLLFIIFGNRAKMSNWVVGGGFGLCAIVIILIKQSGYYDDHFLVWAPFFLGAILVVGYALQYRKKAKLVDAKDIDPPALETND